MRAPGNSADYGITAQLVIFFVISWILVASPVIAYLLRAILSILFGIPLLIYVCKDNENPKEEI